jgi:hypothetical protein
MSFRVVSDHSGNDFNFKSFVLSFVSFVVRNGD